ncbi:MAG TPA: GntR family transcriptional regulator [Bacillota bacterium]|nr:GntR family transcriptional regulator [Bacillota bacterium]
MPIPKDFSTIIKISAKERALSQLQRWIIDGTLLPGEKLVDTELSEALGASRTPIREALQILEIQGFVAIHHGKETRVTKIEKDDILKIYPPFAALQSLAAELTTSIISNEQIENLKRINGEFSKLFDQEQPYKAMELDEEFHNLIVEITDNSYIASFTSTMQMHIRRFKYLFLKQVKPAEQLSVTEHAELIMAFELKDAAKAASVMKKNIMRPMQELYETIVIDN